jgi:hypothetical protein
MKYIGMILTFLLLPQLVFASNVEGLKALVDEYNYTMTVEWNQKDASFAHEQDEKLKSGLTQLLNSGLTKDDFSQAFPSVNFNELESEILMTDLSTETAIKDFALKSRQSYKKGASWNGDAAGFFAAVMLFTFICIIATEAERNKTEIRL